MRILRIPNDSRDSNQRSNTWLAPRRANVKSAPSANSELPLCRRLMSHRRDRQRRRSEARDRKLIISNLSKQTHSSSSEAVRSKIALMLDRARLPPRGCCRSSAYEELAGLSNRVPIRSRLFDRDWSRR
jgi:hypothetical protein